MLFVIDIDGTLADLSQRVHLIDHPEPSEADWDAFFEPRLVSQDKPIEEAQRALDHLIENMAPDDDMIFLSGRPERLRSTTTKWLKDHFDIQVTSDELFLKPDNSREQSHKFKKDVILDNLFDQEDLVIIDDESRNLESLSEYGITLKAPGAWKDILQGELDI